MSDAAYYAKLAAVVDEILEGLKNKLIHENWPVNWADFHCVRIEETRQMYPDERFKSCTVFIEEADPACHELQHDIENALFERGYDVSVETEW